VVRALAASLLAALLLGCAGGDADGPVETALVELAEDQEGFDGRMVTTEGVVRTWDDPRHYWIEDADQHRVELDPQDLIAPHLGDEVRVTGRFTFRDDEGRRIAVDELEVLEEGVAEPA
jgi:hypothetical protein